MSSTVAFEVVSERLDDLGESPVWFADERALRWVDITPGLVCRLEPASGQVTTVEVGEQISCLRPRAGGGAIAGLASGLAFLDLETGASDAIVDPEAGEPRVLLNDGACDAAGRFWVGSYDIDEREPLGSLWRLDPDLGLERMARGLVIGNGIGWSPDGATLYVTDSVARTITAWDAHADGSIENPRAFAQDEDCMPDGLAVDVEGCVWSAKWDGARVVRYRPDGRVDRVVELPMTRVTACAFGGPRLDELYVTSARWGLDADVLAAQPLAGALLRLDPGVRGLPVAAFAG